MKVSLSNNIIIMRCQVWKPYKTSYSSKALKIRWKTLMNNNYKTSKVGLLVCTSFFKRQKSVNITVLVSYKKKCVLTSFEILPQNKKKILEWDKHMNTNSQARILNQKSLSACEQSCWCTKHKNKWSRLETKEKINQIWLSYLPKPAS